MSGYKYDEEGGQFFTFVLTALLALIIPYTYRVLRPKRDAAQVHGWLDQRGHKTRIVKWMMRTPSSVWILRASILVVGWCGVVYLFHRVASAAQSTQHTIYDPFAILGIAASATEREIRRQYRRLSLEFHPDKVKPDASNQTKEEIESHYIELTKAYKALTDETIRKNYEEYGHPDGRQEMSMGIALPTWVVESKNNVWVLAGYGLLFGVVLPVLVARWWYGARSRTKDGVLNATALAFFMKLKPTVSAEDMPLMLAQTEELQAYATSLQPGDETAYKQLESATLLSYKDVYNKELSLEAAGPRSVQRALILFTSYLHRVETGNDHVAEVQHAVGRYSEKLLTSLMAMSTAHNRLKQTNAIRDMTAHVVQAVPLFGGRISEVLQLPHMTMTLAKKVAEHDMVAKQGIQGLWKVPDAERKALLCGEKGMTDEQYAECMRALSEWPRIEMVDAYFTVVGEERVNAGSMMHLVLKLRLLPLKRDGSLLRHGRRLDAKNKDGQDSVRPGTSEDAKPNEAHSGRQRMGYVYAPHFCEERRPQWFMQMGDNKNDHLILSPTKFGDVGVTETRVVHMPIIAPPEPGLYVFQVDVASDSYVGSNASKLMRLYVAEQLMPKPEEEDEISDPEEDSIAGQMAIMRGERVKPSNAVYEEEEDEDEGDEEEDEEEDDDDDDDNDSDSD